MKLLHHETRTGYYKKNSQREKQKFLGSKNMVAKINSLEGFKKKISNEGEEKDIRR